jgi:hypothetical protein
MRLGDGGGQRRRTTPNRRNRSISDGPSVGNIW